LNNCALLSDIGAMLPWLDLGWLLLLLLLLLLLPL
jgi:hypothetical protein